MRRSGFTLIEMVVTLAILTVLVVLGVMANHKNQRKTDLLNAGNFLVDLLMRTQSEAASGKMYKGVCFKQDPSSGIVYAQAYFPSLNASGTPEDEDCDSTDVGLANKIEFGKGIRLCDTCDANIGTNKSIFFSPRGITQLSDGTETNIELCLIHDDMPTGTRAREVEVYKLGQIKLLASSEAGAFTGVTVNQGDCQ